jgi:hypothetical protein
MDYFLFFGIFPMYKMLKIGWEVGGKQPGRMSRDFPES